ncbi:hypothetical protein F5Y01DRAFT_97965 [Xylaria sp. FL0043]|nr:hypothetical protein F5Y01DRAFT_97965 [Xylaria sp. FL0043]
MEPPVLYLPYIVHDQDLHLVLYDRAHFLEKLAFAPKDGRVPDPAFEQNYLDLLTRREARCGGSGFPQSFATGIQNFGFQDHNIGSKRQNPFDSHDEIPTRGILIVPALPSDDTLMSPKVETMTNNPLHDSFSELSGMKFVESPPTPTEGLFSPRETMFPRNPLFPFGRPSQMANPRDNFDSSLFTGDNGPAVAYPMTPRQDQDDLTPQDPKPPVSGPDTQL